MSQQDDLGFQPRLRLKWSDKDVNEQFQDIDHRA
jgi:hypothetical protein